MNKEILDEIIFEKENFKNKKEKEVKARKFLKDLKKIMKKNKVAHVDIAFCELCGLRLK